MFNNYYYNSFMTFWLPIYKRRVFKAVLLNDIEFLINLENNIWTNWNLNKEQKLAILESLNLKKLIRDVVK